MHEARRRTFLEIAARDPKRCVVIDTTLDKTVVAKAIRKAVTERLLSQASKRGRQ
jgi:dTMP kinase